MSPRHLALSCARLLALALFAACAHTLAPENPVWDRQPCDHCRMLLSDKHYGAQVITTNDRRLFFDDFGCMVMHLREHHLAFKKAWVVDEDSGAWIDAEQALYKSGAKTPMDYGFAAHAAGDGVDFVRAADRVVAGQNKNQAGDER